MLLGLIRLEVEKEVPVWNLVPFPPSPTFSIPFLFLPFFLSFSLPSLCVLPYSRGPLSQIQLRKSESAEPGQQTVSGCILS